MKNMKNIFFKKKFLESPPRALRPSKSKSSFENSVEDHYFMRRERNDNTTTSKCRPQGPVPPSHPGTSIIRSFPHSD